MLLTRYITCIVTKIVFQPTLAALLSVLSWCPRVFYSSYLLLFLRVNYISIFIKMQLSGARRLRDAIVLGYQLQRVPGSEVDVPNWYSLSEKEIGVRVKTPTADTSINIFYADS
jgi:hypothetical protein